MESMKRLFVFILCMIFLVGAVSAFEFDNILSYEDNNKTAVINNCNFWLATCLSDGELISKAELKSHKTLTEVLQVGRGRDKLVMYYDFNNFKDNKLGEVYFINMDTSEQIEKSYYFAKAIYGDIEIQDYTELCENKILPDGTFGRSCEYVKDGKHTENKIIRWERLIDNNLEKGKIRVGLFTDVNENDYIDGIWTIAGKKVNKHASWAESLDVGLVGEYPISEGTGTNIQNVFTSLYNGTATNGEWNLTESIDNTNSYQFSSSNTRIDMSGSTQLGRQANLSYVMWLYPTLAVCSAGYDTIVMVGAQTTSLLLDFVGASCQLRIHFAGGGGQTLSTGYLIPNQWNMVTVTHQQGHETRVYLNTTKVLETTGKSWTETNYVRFGMSADTNQRYTGLMDEIFIYNRTLSNQEIIDIYDYFTLNAPVVTLNTPLDNNKYTQSPQTISFNCSSTDDLGVLNMSLILNDIINETIYNTTSQQNLTIYKEIDLTDGNYNWTCKASDDTKETTGNYRDFSIDSTQPQINITFPRGEIFSFIPGSNLTLNWSVGDPNLDSCWFNYNNINTSVICEANNFSFIPVTDVLNLTFFANDSFENLGSNFTSWEVLFEKYNVTFNNQTFEGSQETFTSEIILGLGATISEAIFYYNNTNYSTNIIFSGGEYTITSSILIPLVEEQTNFNLGFLIDVDGTFYDLETFNQSVLSINLSDCGGGSASLLNVSLKDERIKSSLIGTIEINAQAISKTSGETTASISTNFSNVSSGVLCLSPYIAFEGLYLDAEIKYYSDGYAPELYYIQSAEMEDYPKNMSLFDLNNNYSTSFIVTYQDNNLITVENAIIQLQRKYISEDIFEVVEAPLTSDSGKVILHIDLSSNKYQATVVKNGNILDIFDNLVFNCESELTGQCTHNLLGKIDAQTDESVINLRDFSYSISSINNTITTLFSIPSGTPSSVNIQLDQVDLFGNKTQCNQTIVSSGGSIDCDFDNTIGDSFLELKIYKDGKIQAQEGYIVTESSGFDWLDNNFIILLIFLFSLVGMAFASPEIMLIIGVVVMIIGGAFWLVNGLNFVIGLGSIAWLLIAVIILIRKLAKQEDR